jgi:thiol-disulfide isomerase/thioredoxin
MKRLAGGALMLGLVAMLVLNVVWIVRNRASIGGMRSGQAAPDLSLPMLDGGNARLADWRGKVVFLSFWATWCGPCVHELPDVQRLADERPDVIFLAVNTEGTQAASLVRAFRQRTGLRMPIALDDGAASQAYRVDTIPRSVIIGSDGHVVRSLDGAHSLDDMRAALSEAR